MEGTLLQTDGRREPQRVNFKASFFTGQSCGSAHSLIRKKNLALNQSLVGALRTHLDDPNESLLPAPHCS